MIRNYLKMAIRSMQKNRVFTAINILGLALGIAACLLIALYVNNELSYDSTYPDADRIGRVISTDNYNGVTERGAIFPAPLVRVLKNDLPEVEKAGRLMAFSLFKGAGANQVRRADQIENTYEEGFTYADQEILDIFKFPLVYGDRAHALTEPNTLVISKRKADKYFPGQNPVGKILYLNNDSSKPYKIGAVMYDLPANSHLNYDFLVSLTGVEFWNGEQTDWHAWNYDNYVLLRKGTDRRQFDKKLTATVIKKYILPGLNSKDTKLIKTVSEATITLQPVTDIYLRSYDMGTDPSHGGTPYGDIRFIWLFGGIACFILVIACINFINLSTARSANRAKEVGLRKVMGGYRYSLIAQFLTESALLSFLSFVIGVLIAWQLMPYFNQWSGKSLVFPWAQWWLIPVFVLSAAAIGFIAGMYPAFYLSAFKPVNVLKGNVSNGSKNTVLRNTLVVFQFTTSIILIIGTIVIYRQMQYILNTELGYDKEQVLMVQGANLLEGKTDAFKNELLKLSQVKSVSVSDYLPVNGTKRNGQTFHRVDKADGDVSSATQVWRIDTDYLKTLGIKLAAGRNFSKDMPTDTQAVIINQALAKQLLLKDPIGKSISNNKVYQIIGVVEDFNYESLKGNIGPLCMVLENSPSIISVKIGTSNMAGLIPAISGAWKKFAPGQAFRFTFLSDSYANMYADVQRMSRIFACFAVLAIVVACLGLFALAAFMAEQKTREVGIRKVLGASVANITAMLSADFLKLVCLAILIASPIAWYGMYKWLQEFAYRTTIQWWIFALAGAGAILIAVITVSFQSVKAAVANPIKSLRSE
jgi:putative ABC transport system permease protein